eukprot:m.8914 g.8914  ORF g.8914 m.8914 type:complete len:89 (+) comp5561_c1_seq1:368-634(+)
MIGRLIEAFKGGRQPKADTEQSETQLKQQEDWRDCLECRVVGSLSLALSGGYLLRSRRDVPAGSPRLRLFMTGFGYALIGLGALRAVV